LHFITDGADFQAGPAARAFVDIHVAGMLFQGGGEMARFAAHFL
jgi:hypothetical protein